MQTEITPQAHQPQFVLWFRATARSQWREAARGTNEQCTAAMFAAQARGQFGDWCTRPAAAGRP